jgi:O-antigen ligase
LNVSIQNSIKALPPFFFFFIGIKYFQEKDSIMIFFKGMALMLFASVILSIVGYIWDIGYSFQYSKDEDMGGTGMLVGGNLYVVSIAIVSLIVGYSNNTIEAPRFHKNAILVFILVAYILILLTMRRTAILLPPLGLLVILLYNKRILKDFLKYILVFWIIGFISFPLYNDLLFKRYKAREDLGRFEEDFYETESRYLETKRVFGKVFSFEDQIYSFFGHNVLAGGWEGGVARRMDHTDHAQILGTTGIVGAIIYILLYLKFLSYFWKFRIKIKSFRENRIRLNNLNSLYLSVILISLATGINGSIFIITFRTIVFLTLGALVGYISKEIYRNKKELIEPSG